MLPSVVEHDRDIAVRPYQLDCEARAAVALERKTQVLTCGKRSLVRVCLAGSNGTLQFLSRLDGLRRAVRRHQKADETHSDPTHNRGKHPALDLSTECGLSVGVGRKICAKNHIARAGVTTW